nr:pentatricopeptide repeat-containing protein At3g62470, mitochondrial-like [Ipomoea batatas]
MKGFLDAQFSQLQQHQDESNATFVTEVVTLFFEDSERLLNDLNTALFTVVQMALYLRKLQRPLKLRTLQLSISRTDDNDKLLRIFSSESVEPSDTQAACIGGQRNDGQQVQILTRLVHSGNHSCLHYNCYEVPFVSENTSNTDFYSKRKFLDLKYREFCSGVDSGSESENHDEGESECESGCVESKADPREVDRVCKVIDELFSLDRNMEAILDECGINLTHDLVIDVLERFKHARKPAFRFFCWAAQRPGYFHDSKTYNAMMAILGKTRQFETMVSILEEMGEKGLLTIETFVIAMKAFAAAKERKKAVGIFELMKKYKFEYGVESINCLLDALGRAKLGKEAQVMKAKGPSPNARSYTILIRHLCKQRKMDEAIEYFEEMLGTGCEPDVAVYTCLITGFGNIKKMDRVYGLLKEMREKGCPPDAQLYNALIKLMSNRRMPDDVVRIYKKMIQNGVQPTIHTYNMMMKSFFTTRNYELGCAVWEEMNSKGCCPDENSYTVFIGGLIQQGRSVEACKYLEEMIEKGMRAPQLDYNKLAADFSRAGNPDILEELSRRMKLCGKFEVSNLFARWAEMMKKRVKRNTQLTNI